MKAAGWTAFGQTVAENLRSRPPYNKRPMRTIPLGIDTEVFHPDADARQGVFRKLGWTDDGPPVVGYLGRFVPEKGLDLLTRVLDRLKPGTWRALLVGAGSMEGSLRTWAARHGESVARVVTGVKHDEVPPYLNAMDLLTAPSQTRPNWKEQLGRMLLEAMASGVPVLASDSGEIPYVVADAGRIVPEADDEAWVNALAEFLDSPDQRAEFARRGLERAHDTYAWPRIARQYLDFFEELHAGSTVTV